MDVFRKQLDYPELKQAVISNRTRWQPQSVLIEDKGSGTSLIQDLKSNHAPCIGIIPTGDKVMRMSACTAMMEERMLFLPSAASWLDDFKAELFAFPHSRYDEQADAFISTDQLE